MLLVLEHEDGMIEMGNPLLICSNNQTARLYLTISRTVINYIVKSKSGVVSAKKWRRWDDGNEESIIDMLK